MKFTFALQNMKCGGCSNTILKNISMLNGIHDVSVNVENETLSFEADSDFNIDIIKKVLARLGYPLANEKNPWSSKAKSYVSCAIGKMQKAGE